MTDKVQRKNGPFFGTSRRGFLNGTGRVTVAVKADGGMRRVSNKRTKEPVKLLL